jgi:hypothetical protein
MTSSWDIEYCNEEDGLPERKTHPCEQCGNFTDAIAFCHYCGSPLFDPDEEILEDSE